MILAATIYAAFTAAVALYILATTILNSAWLFHSNMFEPATKGPLVSVLIPARNEAERIEACVDSFLDQRYSNFEIIVYDDDSTDATGEILDRRAEEYPGKLRVIHGKGLESGWYGKPHAMQRLSEAAKGEWLLFSDADTIHEPRSIGAAVRLAEIWKADLVSGYIRHTMGSFGETAVVPSIYLLTMIAMPLWLIQATKTPLISHAIGQYMFFRTSKYREFGGYGAVRDMVSEDVRIARKLKEAGGKAVFVDLKNFASCRMYDGYKSAMAGLSKNVFDYLGKNFAILLLGTIAVPLLFLVPIIGAAWVPDALGDAQPFFRLGVMLLLYAWLIVTMERRLPWDAPLIYPIIFINVLSTAWRAFHLFFLGKSIEWKGRMVK
jgi:chlorobactene glucosyltransferase